MRTATAHANRPRRRLRRYLWLAIPVGLLYLAPGWPAFGQTEHEVAVREPGERQLRPPQPAVQEARNHVDFAFLSEAAYDPTDPEAAAESASEVNASCPGPRVALQRAGWTPWTDFPSRELQDQIVASHLRVQVWSHAARPAVAVTFGGTVFNNPADWMANLRWFIPTHEDQYTQIVKRVGPAFVREFTRRQAEPSWSFLNKATIYSTGHSLGGGLAQQFAYALPLDARVPRVAQVYGFDPSPVTGFYSVDAEVRDANRKSLQIDRTYERGEILAGIRIAVGVVYPPSADAPRIRNVRYDLIRRRNPLAGHSIRGLACGLYAVAQASPR